MNRDSRGGDRGRAEEQLIGALVPDRARPVSPAPVPLSVLPPPPLQPPEPSQPSQPSQPRPAPVPMVDTAQVDRSGRVQSGRVLRALRWRPGDDLRVELVTDSPSDPTALLVTPIATPVVTPPVPDRDVGAPSRPRRPSMAPPGSRCQVDTRGAITLPAAARALCGITVGDTVVLVADPAIDRLVAYSALLAARLLLTQLLPPATTTAARTPPPQDTGHHQETGRHQDMGHQQGGRDER